LQSSKLKKIHSFLVLLLAFKLQLYSNTATIRARYCIEDNSLKTSQFVSSSSQIEIIQLPNFTSSYSIPSIKLKEKLKQYDIEDKSGGVVTFYKNCNQNYEKSKIKQALRKKFLSHYQSIKIRSISVNSTIKSLPDLKGFKFSHININRYNLYKKSGVFQAVFTKKHLKRNVSFRFDIDAKHIAFVTKQNIKRNQKITLNNIEKKYVSLGSLPSNTITKISQILGYEAKINLKARKAITSNILKKSFIVKKHQKTRAKLVESGLEFSLTVQALGDGNVGDIIKVVNSNGKILNAKIISNNEVLIIE
jgi:flagella basal body P-ring formation protein FlgA